MFLTIAGTHRDGFSLRKGIAGTHKDGFSYDIGYIQFFCLALFFHEY